MDTATRRTLLKRLLSLPIVGSIAKLNVFAMESPAATASEEEERKRQFLAVRILRLINTAEAWHFGSLRQYADLETLRKSDALAQLLKSEKAEEKGIGRSLYSTLRFDTDDITSGWAFSLRVGERGSSYEATMTDTTEKGMDSFKTDHTGIIRGSKEPLESVSFWQQATQRASSFLKSIALGPLATPQIGCCCYGGNCCCYCPHCISHCFFSCYNCGCGNCPWCG